MCISESLNNTSISLVCIVVSSHRTRPSPGEIMTCLSWQENVVGPLEYPPPLCTHFQKMSRELDTSFPSWILQPSISAPWERPLEVGWRGFVFRTH